MFILFVSCFALLNPPPPVVSRRSILGAAAAAGSAGQLLLPAAPASASVLSGGGREELASIYVTPGGVEIKRARLTGVGDPKWTYPQKDISADTYSAARPTTWPYTAADFVRLDEAPDTAFYRFPKLVYHIDEGAVCALQRYYDSAIADGSDVLDICSSWVSHYPRDFMRSVGGGVAAAPGRMRSLTGTGISQIELASNDQLSKYVQADLNAAPKLPFPDRSFDAVTCVVSFDYLTRPLEVMREVQRVLRPGGSLILSQSNRCFYSKAVGAWTADMSDAAHLRYLGNVVHFAGGFDAPRAIDISPAGHGTNDPIFIVTAKRLRAA